MLYEIVIFVICKYYIVIMGIELDCMVEIDVFKLKVVMLEMIVKDISCYVVVL